MDKHVQRLLSRVSTLEEQVNDLSVNVDVVNELSYEMKYNQEEKQPEDNFFINRKKEQALRSTRKFAHIYSLSMMKQKMTDVCPCGKHKGISFIDYRGEVAEENMCPKTWWIDLNWLALKENNHSFSKSTPLSIYMKAFVR